MQIHSCSHVNPSSSPPECQGFLFRTRKPHVHSFISNIKLNCPRVPEAPFHLQSTKDHPRSCSEFPLELRRSSWAHRSVFKQLTLNPCSFLMVLLFNARHAASFGMMLRARTRVPRWSCITPPPIRWMSTLMESTALEPLVWGNVHVSSFQLAATEEMRASREVGRDLCHPLHYSQVQEHLLVLLSFSGNWEQVTRMRE